MVWLESVSNTSLCNWFYLMFILNLIVSVVMIVRIIVMLVYTRPGILMGSMAFILTVLAVTIPVINGAVFYALCDRALPADLISVPQPIKTNERNLVFGTF